MYISFRIVSHCTCDLAIRYCISLTLVNYLRQSLDLSYSFPFKLGYILRFNMFQVGLFCDGIKVIQGQFVPSAYNFLQTKEGWNI